jgi:hypothetical protein
MIPHRNEIAVTELIFQIFEVDIDSIIFLNNSFNVLMSISALNEEIFCFYVKSVLVEASNSERLEIFQQEQPNKGNN